MMYARPSWSDAWDMLTDLYRSRFMWAIAGFLLGSMFTTLFLVCTLALLLAEQS